MLNSIPTPYYLIDEARLLRNLKKIELLRTRSGARVLLALKCFATWSVFDLMKLYMDGTTSSSLYEVRLGREKFGGETHAYSVAYADHEINAVLSYADKIIFNSTAQLKRFANTACSIPRGLRLNPRISHSAYLLADPARPYSRLGEYDCVRIEAVMDLVSGFMIHNNCENRSFSKFAQMLEQIEEQFGYLFYQVQWVSLGGGIHFTGEDYDIEAFADRIHDFSEKYDVQVYLEPGEAAITDAATLEVSVLDVLHQDKNLVIVDSSIEAHMLDLLIYQNAAHIASTNKPNQTVHRYMVCGKSCLAGDIFGEFDFAHPLAVGDRISIQDAAGYTMVKKNWFNGLNMPSIVIRRLDGSLDVVKTFEYEDYVSSLS